MKKSSIYLIVIAFAVLLLSNCKKEDEPEFVHDFGSFTDSRDGQVYKTIEIGTQTWFAENLAYEGAGQEITSLTEWENNTAFDGWCYYENDKATYGSTYGILYQWEVAKIACPEGWHMLANSDWFVLRDLLGDENAGSKLKEAGTTHWDSPNTGTNETGFTALPGGSRRFHSFLRVGDKGYWWSSTMYDSGTSWGWSMSHAGNNLSNFHGFYYRYNGLSVRCLKE